jgi:hypothetical protein
MSNPILASVQIRDQRGAVELQSFVLCTAKIAVLNGRMVESRMRAVAWGLWPSPRFPSPLIKPDVPISGIRLSDWLHREARDVAVRGRRWRHRTPSSR